MKNDCRSSFGLYRFKIAIVCAFVVVLVAHHPIAGAQQADGAMMPAVPPDAADVANRQLKLDYSVTPIVLRIALPPADTTSQRSAAEASKDWPPQIGFHRTIPSEFQGDLSSLIDWVSLDDGSIVGTLSVTSPEASAMRAGIHADLVAGGEIRFFGERTVQGHAEQRRTNQDPHVITRADFHVEGGGSEILWSPIVEGDTLGVEITLPSREAVSALSFRIEKVSHIYDPTGSHRYVPKLDCSNHIDVQCRVGDFPRNQETGVARIFFDTTDGTYVCTGTLIEDKVDGAFIPYFMTANHCISTAEVARSVIALWFYQREACGNNDIDSRFERTFGGADLLATNIDQDSTLLRLKSLPTGRPLHFSGWSADPVSHPADIYGLHYPADQNDRYAGVMKYSAGKTIRNEDAQIGDFVVENAIVMQWSEGVAEGGSSGSGLFRDQYLIGVLSGGPPGCVNNFDAYGPFQDFYPQVARWLNPSSALSSHTLPFVTPASNVGQPGFVRVINRTNRAGTVRIVAIDDTGRRFGPVTLSLAGGQTRHFSSRELEQGLNRQLTGLSGGVGNGTGNWRLELATTLDIEPLAYIRRADGFVTSMHEVTAETRAGSRRRYRVPLFHPASDRRNVSRLRLINPGPVNANIVISGVDDLGKAQPGGLVLLTMMPGTAHMLTAQQLEQGDSSLLSGRLGDGSGRWQLLVSANRPIQVMSLLRGPTGHLANLSRGQAVSSDGGPPPPPPPPPSYYGAYSFDSSSTVSPEVRRLGSNKIMTLGGD